MDMEDDLDNGPLKRPRASLACYRCHNKKVRCDGVHPNCSRCSVAGVLCAYPSSRRSRNTTSLNIDPFIDNLSQFEDRIRKIEAVVQAQKSLIMSLVEEGKIDDADILSRPSIGLEESFGTTMLKTEGDIQDSKAILAQLRLRGEKDALAARRNSNGPGHVEAESEDDVDGDANERAAKRRMITRWEANGPPMLVAPHGTGNWALSITKNGLRIDTNAPTIADLYDILLHGINQINLHKATTSGGNKKWFEARTPHWLKQQQYVTSSAQKQKETLAKRKKKKLITNGKTANSANGKMAPRTGNQRLKLIGSPPRELLDHLINIYFSCYYPMLPIFDKQAFYAEYTEPEDDDEHGHLILNSMYALATRHACISHQFTKYDKIDVAQKVEVIFHETAKSSLYRIHDKVDIRLVQACLLLALYQLETQAGTASAYLYSGYASRCALFLELQKDKSGELDTMTYELNKRVFWSVYLVDFLTSSAAGRPFMIMDSEVKVDLPSPFPVIEEQFESDQETEGFNMQRFVEYLKLIRIQKQMGFAKSQATDRQPHEALLEWMNGLPEPFHLENEIFSTSPSSVLAHNALVINIEYHASLLLLKMPELPEIFDESAFMPNSPLDICSFSATTISNYLETLSSIAHCSIPASPIQRALALSSAFHAWNMQYSSPQDMQISRDALTKNLSTIKRLDGFKISLRSYRHLESRLELFLNGQGTWSDLLEGSLAVSRNTYRFEFAPSSPPQVHSAHSPLNSSVHSPAPSSSSRQASPPLFQFPSLERRHSSTSTSNGRGSSISSETRKKNERWNLALIPSGFRMDTNITKVSDLYEILVDGLSQLSMADSTGALATRPNPEAFSRSAAVPTTKATNPRGYENYWPSPSKTDPLIDEQPQELLDQTVIWWLKENQASEVAPHDWFMQQYDELKVEMDPLMINSIYAWGMRQATLNYGMFEDYNANTVGDLYFNRAQAAFEGRMFEETNWKTVVGMFNMGMYAGPMSYIYLGMGMRIMLELGWHRKEFMPPSGDLIEREVCKRIFWLMYIVDTMNEHFYNLPPGLNLADCDIEPAMPFPNSDKESLTKCELMVRYVDLLDILKDIHKAISTSDQILLSDIAHIENSLTSFYDNLPEDWKYPTPTGELLPDYVYVLHTDYHAFWMELHQSFLRRAEDGSKSKKLSPSTLVSLHICVEHSEIVTEMMELYVEHYGPQNFFQALDGITMATDTYKDVIELSDDTEIVATAVQGIARTIKLLRRTRAYDRQMAVKGLALDLEQWAAKRKLKLNLPKEVSKNGFDDRVPPIPQPQNTSAPMKSSTDSNSNNRKRAHRQSMGGIQFGSMYGQPANALVVNTYVRDGVMKQEDFGLLGANEIGYNSEVTSPYSVYSNSPSDLNGDVNDIISGMVVSMPMSMNSTPILFDDYSSAISTPEIASQATNYLHAQQPIFKNMGYNTDQNQTRPNSAVYYSDEDEFSQTSALDHTLFMSQPGESPMQYVSTPGHHPVSPSHYASQQQQQFHDLLSEQQLQQQQQQQQQHQQNSYFATPPVLSPMSSGLPSPTPVRSQNFGGESTSPTGNQLQFHHFFGGSNSNVQESITRQQKRWYEA